MDGTRAGVVYVKLLTYVVTEIILFEGLIQITRKKLMRIQEC